MTNFKNETASRHATLAASAEVARDHQAVVITRPEGAKPKLRGVLATKQTHQ